MNHNQIKAFGVLLLLLLLFFVVVGTFSGCRGASIYGHQIIPDVNTENNSTVFYEIYDLDSTVHWFVHLYDGEIWCYYHNRYEMVKKSVRR